ncbi:phosphatidate cytidylyltransferase [Alphaproteobacteria bacterium]|nr:phosphatidate cytidylyltransferase [Alphaproteobacteria bacterium]
MVKDFQLRFFSSIFLFIPLFFLFSKNNFIFLFVIQILLSLSLWEFFRLKSFKDYHNKQKKINILLSRHKISSLDFVIIFKVNLALLLTFYYSNIMVFVVLIFFLLYSYIILKFDFEKLLGLIYCSTPFFILVNLRNDYNYEQFLFFIFFFTILTDVFAFFSGKILKGKKIYPSISSGKTVSGTIGGIVIPCILSLLMFINLKDFYLVVFSSIFFSMIVQLGDFLESYFKRLCNVKDSGNLIPGHGGVLDRFDGLFLLIIVIFILKILNFNFFFII